MSNLVKHSGAASPQVYSPQPPMPPMDIRPESESFEVSLRDFFRVILSRKWLIASVIVTTMVGVMIQVLTTTPTYRSTVTIQIDPESDAVLPYKGLLGGAGDDEAYLQTQYEILHSRGLARRVIERLNLESDPVFNAQTSSGVIVETAAELLAGARSIFSRQSQGPPASEQVASDGETVEDAELVDFFLRNLQVNPLKTSRLVDVAFVSHSPALAKKIVNTLADEYIERNFEARYEATTKAGEFIGKKLQELKADVEKSEQALMDYARRNNILNINESEAIIRERLGELSREMTRIEAALIEKRTEFNAVKSADPGEFPVILKNPSIATLEDRLNELDQRLASLSTRFGPEWPDIQQVKQEIQKVRDQLASEQRQAIARVRMDFEVAQQHFDMFASAMADEQAKANKWSEDSIQYNILKREAESNKELFDGLLQRMKEAGVSAGLKSSNLRIVDSGELPRETYRPQKTLNVLLGLAFSLVAAVLLAFLVEHVDSTLKTPADVEEFLGLPSLGVIPNLEGVLVEAGDIGSGGTRSGLVFRHSPAFARDWEAYRSFRTSILLSHSGRPPQKILITSSFPNEGKTTTVANTGIVLAQTGARTLLVDLDLRKSSLTGALGIQTDRGISNFLSGNADLASQICRTSIDSLQVLGAGPIPPNPAELLASKQLAEALKILAQQYKYIVIDSPPVLSVTDAQLISPLADGVILVVHGSKTPREVARRAGTLLRAVGAHILGVMINRVDIQRMEYYGEYYGRYDYGDYGDQARIVRAG